MRGGMRCHVLAVGFSIICRLPLSKSKEGDKLISAFGQKSTEDREKRFRKADAACTRHADQSFKIQLGVLDRQKHLMVVAAI